MYHCIGRSFWIFCVSHKSVPQDCCAVGISQAVSSRLIEERCRCRITMLLEGGVRVDPHSNCYISWDSPSQITRGWSAQTDRGEDKGVTKSSLQKRNVFCFSGCDSALSRSTIKLSFNMDAVMLRYFLKEKIYIDSQKNQEESVQVLSASVSSRKHWPMTNSLPMTGTAKWDTELVFSLICCIVFAIAIGAVLKPWLPQIRYEHSNDLLSKDMKCLQLPVGLWTCSFFWKQENRPL